MLNVSNNPFLFILPLAVFLGYPRASTAVATMPTSKTTPAAAKVDLQPYVDRGVIAGAVTLVADGDRVLSLEACGDADRVAKKPMRPDSIFWVASQTKSFTATALMILVDEGKVRLDDPVEKYLPEFSNLWLAVEKDDAHMLLKRPQHRITVRHLLSHTSGLPHFSALEDPVFAATGVFGITRVSPLRDAVRGYAMTPLQFEPGSKWQYCNAGINTAGRIIEVVSGMPYEQFLEERLFRPLGMKDTTFSPGKKQLSRLAKAYRKKAGSPRLEETPIFLFEHPLDGRKNVAIPAGGLFSTAPDLGRFCQMLLNGGVIRSNGGKRILSEAAIREMTTRQANTSDGQGYGLGWFTNPDRSFGHNGSFSTVMTIDPEHRLVKLFLVQFQSVPGDGNAVSEAYAAFNKGATEQFIGSSQ